MANYRGADWDFNGKFYPGNYGAGPKGKYREATTDVLTFPANGWGLYDMHGSVWEWCADHWHDNYTQAPADGTPWKTAKKATNHLLRGGSWFSFPQDCRSAYRRSRSRGHRDDFTGFRASCTAARTL